MNVKRDLRACGKGGKVCVYRSERERMRSGEEEV